MQTAESNHFKQAFVGLPPDQVHQTQDILQQAARQHLQKKAGFVPPTLVFKSVQLPELPHTTPPAFVALLQHLLERRAYPMLAYAIGQAAGQQINPEVFPALFRHGLHLPAHYPLIFDACHPVAHWLAAQNPEWHVYLPYGHPANAQPSPHARLRHAEAQPEALPELLDQGSITPEIALEVMGQQEEYPHIPLLARLLEQQPYHEQALALLYRHRAEPWYGRLQTAITAWQQGRTTDHPPEFLAALMEDEHWQALPTEQLSAWVADPNIAAGLVLSAHRVSSPAQQYAFLECWYARTKDRSYPHLATLAAKLPPEWRDRWWAAAPKAFFWDALHPDLHHQPLPDRWADWLWQYFQRHVFPHTPKPDSERWMEALEQYCWRVPLSETESWQLDIRSVSPFWQANISTYQKILRTRNKIDQTLNLYA
ncbi:MAG: hypothetical protein ACFCUI_03060 [Bernardetiaceae bacterium]